MKKAISTLSASLLLACNSSSAIQLTPGSNALVVFNTAGKGSFWMDSGVSTDDIVRTGAGFTLQVDTAAAALGGTIESFAILGLTTQTAPTVFNYDESVYVDPGAGFIFASTDSETFTSSLQTNHGLGLEIFRLKNSPIIAAANFGYNGEGTNGDFDSSPLPIGLPVIPGSSVAVTTPYLTPTSSIPVPFQFVELFHNHYTALLPAQTQITRESQEAIDICSDGYDGYDSFEQCMEFWTSPLTFPSNPFTLENNTFTLAGTAVPIPGAAWLFISALGGLTITKR